MCAKHELWSVGSTLYDSGSVSVVSSKSADSPSAVSTTGLVVITLNASKEKELIIFEGLSVMIFVTFESVLKRLLISNS